MEAERERSGMRALLQAGMNCPGFEDLQRKIDIAKHTGATPEQLVAMEIESFELLTGYMSENDLTDAEDYLSFLAANPEK